MLSDFFLQPSTYLNIFGKWLHFNGLKSNPCSVSPSLNILLFATVVEIWSKKFKAQSCHEFCVKHKTHDNFQVAIYLVQQGHPIEQKHNFYAKA